MLARHRDSQLSVAFGGRFGYPVYMARKKTKPKKRKFRLIGRDAGTGRFKPVAAARRDKKGSIVQRIRLRTGKKRRRS